MYVIPFILNRYRNQIESVQHGSISLTTGNAINDTIAAVIKNKSLLLYSYTTEENQQDPSTELLCGRILNSTTIQFLTDSAVADDIDIVWTVIEFSASSNFNVQHFAGSATGAAENITISAVDLSHSFALMNFATADNTFQSDHYGQAKLTTATNLQLNWAAINSNYYAAQVVEFDAWDVTVYNQNMLAGSVSSDQGITAVNLSETMLFASAYDSGTGAALTGDQILIYGFNTTSNINSYRRVSGHGLNLNFFVVETNGTVKTDQDNNETITAGNFQANWNHTTINWNFSAYMHGSYLGVSWGNNQTDALIRGEDLAVRLNNASSTQVTQTRGFYGSVVVRNSLQVYDFSNL